MVRRARYSPSHSKINFPVRRDIQVNGREKLLLLLRNGIKAADGPQRSVVFQAASNDFGEIVRHLCVGRKFKTLADIITVQGLIDSGIEREVPGPNLFIDDG